MKIVGALVAEGNLYEVASEDGPRAVFDYFVDVVAEDGNRYRHEHNFKQDLHSANKLCDKVNDAGEVNLSYWVKMDYVLSYSLGEVDEVSLMDDEERFYRGV